LLGGAVSATFDRKARGTAANNENKNETTIRERHDGDAD
jgi:hypothetical protein